MGNAQCIMATDNVSLLYKAGYIICCAGNLIEENSCLNMSELLTGLRLPEVC
jgi:hypothetical protein